MFTSGLGDRRKAGGPPTTNTIKCYQTFINNNYLYTVQKIRWGLHTGCVLISLLLYLLDYQEVFGELVRDIYVSNTDDYVPIWTW